MPQQPSANVTGQNYNSNATNYNNGLNGGNVTTTAGLNLRDQMNSLQEEQQDDEEDMIEEEIME